MRCAGRILGRAALALFVAGAAQAQDWLANAPGGNDLQLMQMFRVETQGPRARREGQVEDPGFISEVGTAFAIAPNALMTAKHVPHEAREFRNTSQSSVVWIPNRVVEISFAQERLADPIRGRTQQVTITPSPFPTVDASRINVAGRQVTPFPLSVCPIRPGGNYFLLKMRDGNLGEPVIVPIMADTTAHSGAGELRLFSHGLPPGHQNMPEPGDSGSPILDEEGRVVGLLTAIIEGRPDVYVTLTRNWVDLVPPTVKVACDTSVTTDDLSALKDEMMAALEAGLEPVRQDVAALQTTTQALGETDEDLTRRLDELVINLNTVSRQVNATVQALIEDFDAETFGDEDAPEAQAQFLDLIKKLTEAEPVVPTVGRVNIDVARMADELSEETWSFGIGAFDRAKGEHLIELRYDRDISAPIYSEELVFCFIGMMYPSPDMSDEEIDDLRGSEDFKNRGFYRSAERDPKAKMTCQVEEHQEQGRGGFYKYSLRMNDPRFDDFEDWNGAFYGLVFNEDNIDEETGRPRILHRMVLVTDPETPSEPLDCYYFADSSQSSATDRVSVLAQNFEREVDIADRCPS